VGKASRRKADSRSQSLFGVTKTTVQAVFAGAKDVRVGRNLLPQEEKISHALAALLAAEVPDGSPLDEYRAALDFIVLAWNISLLKADKQADALHQLAVAREGEEAALQREAVDQIERLIARKQAMFPHDKRFVAAAKVRFQGRDHLHVTGVALASPPQFDAAS
jgi:hypothetical protein